MKKFLLFAVVAILFAACTQDVAVEILSPNIADDAPETLTVGFEGDDTRIQLNENVKTVWTNGDQVSVFYRSDANQKWQYNGETGLRTGELECVDSGVETIKTSRIIIAYPYNENYGFDSATYSVTTSMPATQTYMEDSFGPDGNIMVSSSESDQFTLKSVYGWVKLQLTGNGERVKSISLCGNDGEQVAGDVVINTPDATITLAVDSDKSDATIFTEVTLDCGEGVELGAEATAFYIALPPQTYANGITVDIKAVDGSTMTKSTGKELVIERNHIQPMKAFVYEGIRPQPNTEIWYTNGSTTEPTAPYKPKNFGGATIQSNLYDAEKECWVITFDKEVTEIGDYAFGSCTNLTNITIPDSVTSIGYDAFYKCDSLTSVTIPDSVTSIGMVAFYGCSSLATVYCKPTIPPAGGDSMFDNNAAGRRIYVPVSDDDSIINAYKVKQYWNDYKGSIFEIGENVDTIKPANNEIWYTATAKVEPYYTDEFGATYLSNVWDSETGKGVITFEGDVTKIGYDVFAYCDSLTSVTIPDSVITIGGSAFYHCDSLTSVTIPDSVITIGGSAFYHCDSLTSVTIPDSVITIGGSAFYHCDSLTSVTIGDSVTTIGDYAFRYCNSLKEFKGKFAADNGRCLIMDNTIIAYANASGTTYTIPDSVTTIGNYAFSSCSSLTSVTIPDSVTTIGEYAFAWCKSLTSVTIPNSVTTIGGAAFYQCSSLTSVTIPDSVTTIGGAAFYQCSSLTSVTIPDSVTTIGKNAFYSCESLTSVTIPDSVTTIGDYAFHNCDSLTSVTIPDSVTTIGSSAFSHCDSLTSVNIGNSVITIGGSAFYSCESLTSVTIGDSVITIGDYAFYSCESLTSVTIPDSVTTIGNQAFCSCKSLTSVTIPDSVTTIGEQAFSWCDSLTSVTIGNSVTTIGNYAFYGCSKLTSVTIPDSVTTIGERAFYSCSSLKTVYCKRTTPPTGGYNMFYGNASDRKIYVPAGSGADYKEKQYWSTYKDYIYESSSL